MDKKHKPSYLLNTQAIKTWETIEQLYSMDVNVNIFSRSICHQVLSRLFIMFIHPLKTTIS